MDRLVGLAPRLPWIGPRVAIRLHRYGLGPSAIDWPTLAELVERHRPAALSVDVFDTCIIRDLLGDQPIELAIDRRADAADAAGAATETAAELEMSLCRPVPGVAASLARIRSAGVSVTFVSDTDRSSATLRSILEDADILVEGDRLFASCEEGATKSSGELYDHVWPTASTDAGEVWHVGNDLWSDVTMADRAGLRGIPMTVAEPTRYETLMAAPRPGSAGPAVSSAARVVRLEALAALDGADPDAGARLEILGADVAGQAFAAFLLWVAEQSRNNDIGHLAFLSRDAELLLDMARVMPADHWADTRLSYMHCSRWSWMIAGAASYGVENWLRIGTADDRSFINADKHVVPLVSLLGRIGLEVDDLGGRGPLEALEPDRPLPDSMDDQWQAFLTEPSVQSLILSRSTERRDLIAGYLRGLDLPSTPVGLIDVGWRGRLAWAMSPVVAEVTGHEPIHFHFGGDKVFADVDETVDIRRFAFDGLGPPSGITNPVSCVETITASGRARVVGYEPDGKGFTRPVFEREVSEIRNEDRRRLWAGATKVAANLPSRLVLEQLGCEDVSLGPEARSVLTAWWTEPRRVEAQAMQGLAFEADDDGQNIKPLVNPYSPKEISRDERLSRQWQQGSVVVSPRPMRDVARLYKLIRSRLDRYS